MDNLNVLNQMAVYDFNSPINVTMIFEDSDDDDAAFEPKERNNTKNNHKNKEDSVERCKSESSKFTTNAENQIKDNCLDRSVICFQENYEIQKTNILSEEINKQNAENIVNNYQNLELRNNTNANQQALIVTDKDIVNNEKSLSSTNQMNEHDPINTFVEDILHKLSENIFLIMQAFYHYGCRRTTSDEDNKKRQKVFNFIKSHFFELSYTTVESIILPQELNESFVNHFLDNTVQIANSKSFNWKCHRGHVKPFFNELLKWTKQKRHFNKKYHQQNSSNENIILKQHLVRPLRPFPNLPISRNLPNTNITGPPNTQDNLCIFSSGAPGSEISINIDANTLRHVTDRHIQITGERNGNDNLNPVRNTSVASHPPYENSFNNIQKNNTGYIRSPPPNNMNHNSKSFVNKLQQKNPINETMIQNYLFSALPHQNHQSQTVPNQNYQTQINHINTTQPSPPGNLLQDNQNIISPTHGAQFEKQMTFNPVITNVSSYNPKTRNHHLRCFMCGRNISMMTAPYLPPCRQIYCSYLCQELDSQSYKPAWANT